MAERVDYCGPVKTIHKRFCLATLEKLTRDFLGGSYLVLVITPIVHGYRPLGAIGYMYNYRKDPGYIATEGAELLNQVIHIHIVSLILSNFYIHPVVRPNLIGRYSNACRFVIQLK